VVRTAKQIMASAHNFRRLAKKSPLHRDRYMKLARLGLKLANVATKRNPEPENDNQPPAVERSVEGNSKAILVADTSLKY
jgi:hypothetical protein